MLGEFTMFSWKSRAKQQEEQTQYEKWAFPYGEKQRENLVALLKELYPREDMAMVLVPFLTCKELYDTALKNNRSRTGAVDVLINDYKKYKRIIKKTEMTTYLAVVLADSDLEENAVYPSADEIRESVKELDKQKRDEKKTKK